jgi:hypothetical protein
MMQIAREKYRVKTIHISCFNDNLAGLLLYSSLGFTPCEIEERIDHHGNKVALIHMTYQIKKGEEYGS